MNLDEKLLALLKETTSRFLELQKEVSSRLNIKKNFYKILLKLGIEKCPINQTCLGELCSIDKPATSRLVADMEKEDLILKTNKEGNRKEIFITITEKGKEMIDKISALLDELKPKYFNELKDSEKEILINLFENHLLKEKDHA